ncbi:MAG TPA: hypothetical protein VFP50_12420 [Anaeromyxobacteraceae bacterium]|nr:hypothetical protein [Anaeromyxobacteraceae bacterium]
MRYVVRDAQGNELTVPSLRTLHALYDQGFLGDDDLVRMESSERWVRAGSMPALHGARQRRRDPRTVLAILFAAVALAAAVALLFAARAR